MNQRRKFLQQSALAGSGLLLAPWLLNSCSSGNQTTTAAEETTEASAAPAGMFFEISLAQWSLHNALFAKEIDNLDFATVAKTEFGISAVEYVNQFFKDKATDAAYLAEMNQRAADHGVTNVLIMCDGEGNLGDLDDAERTTAVENHYKWVEAAKTLGCHSIRVNAAGKGTAEEVKAAAIDGLGRLSEFAAQFGLNVIVENHGGYSSDGSWLASVMAGVGMDNCGTLPDFGNFCIERGEDYTCKQEYDRYQGVIDLMPYAKGVSAKSHVFNETGEETQTDYGKMLQIVKEAGYSGYIGVEYEGR
ncbi:MAG: sugar phosphate isomerase/epimerase family protein [Bacteroidota bacterium]